MHMAMRSVAIAATTLFLLTGCGSQPMNQPTSQPDGGLVLRQNEGYSALYGLMKSESQVSGILIIKHADPPVAELIQQISALAQDAKQKLEAFAKADNRLVFDVNDLPKVEQQAHKYESDDDENALLTSSGDVFQTRLIFTQAQAMGYASVVSRALVEVETDPARKTFLEALSQRCDDMQKKAMALLTVKSR
jgi:hypothetical protein